MKTLFPLNITTRKLDKYSAGGGGNSVYMTAEHPLSAVIRTHWLGEERRS